MGTQVTKTPQARRDLVEIADFIGRDSLRAAERFLDAAEAAFGLLATMPEMGTLCDFQTPVAAGVRVWAIRGFENHLIFYCPRKNGVHVVRVIHATRDIRRLFGIDDGPERD